MQESDAEKISILMMQINSKVNDSAAFVRDNGTDKEYQEYKRNAGQVTKNILDIASRIYVDHPNLKPQQLGGKYQVDESIFADRFYAWE